MKIHWSPTVGHTHIQTGRRGMPCRWSTPPLGRRGGRRSHGSGGGGAFAPSSRHWRHEGSAEDAPVPQQGCAPMVLRHHYGGMVVQPAGCHSTPCPRGGLPGRTLPLATEQGLCSSGLPAPRLEPRTEAPCP
jgi:hypothetical protein